MRHLLSVGTQEEISISRDVVPNVAWCFVLSRLTEITPQNRNRCINTNTETQTISKQIKMDRQTHEVSVFMLCEETEEHDIAAHCNLAGINSPTCPVMYCQRYHSTDLYYLQISIWQPAICLQSSFSVGGSLACCSGNSSLEQMTLARTDVHNVETGALHRRGSANPGEARNLASCKG